MTTQFVSLKQFAESKTEGVQKRTIFGVDPYKVHIEQGWNGRLESPDLDEDNERLYQLMKSNVQVPPIELQIVEGKMVVRDGHRRTLAARRIVDEGGEYILDARQFRGNDEDAVFLMIGTGTGSRHLTPLEQGLQYLRLMRMGVDIATIAAKLHIHRSTVENGIQLAEMPTAVQKLVAAGKVAAHTALKTVKAHGAKEATKMLQGASEAAPAGKKVKPKQLPAGPAPKPRGQTLPPPQSDAAGYEQAQHIKSLEEYNGRLEARVAELEGKERIKIVEGAVSAPIELKLPPLNPPIGIKVEASAGNNAPHVLAIVKRLAEVNTVVSVLDRATIVQLVQDARKLLGK